MVASGVVVEPERALLSPHAAFQYRQMPLLLIDTVRFGNRAVSRYLCGDALLKPSGIRGKQVVGQAVRLITVGVIERLHEPRIAGRFVQLPQKRIHGGADAGAL